MEYDEFPVMNTTILMEAEGAQEQVVAGFQEARRFILESEARLTRFSADSELSRLNGHNGNWVQVSTLLYDLLKSTQSYYSQTSGLFDPSILPALKRAGYDRSMDLLRQGTVKPDKTIVLHENASFGAIKFDDATASVWLPPGMEIDLGGIAKGWIAEQAAGILSHYSTACAVNAGGDLFLVGLPGGQGKWEVELEDPRRPDQNLAVIQVGPGAVATSSITKRFWQVEGQGQHHLIDPRNGLPANSEWLSVTAIAPHAATAEVFAKAVLIAGSQQAADLLSGHRDLAVIAVDRQGGLWGSPNSKEFFDVRQ